MKEVNAVVGGEGGVASEIIEISGIIKHNTSTIS